MLRETLCWWSSPAPLEKMVNKSHTRAPRSQEPELPGIFYQRLPKERLNAPLLSPAVAYLSMHCSVFDIHTIFLIYHFSITHTGLLPFTQTPCLLSAGPSGAQPCHCPPRGYKIQLPVFVVKTPCLHLPQCFPPQLCPPTNHSKGPPRLPTSSSSCSLLAPFPGYFGGGSLFS